MGHFSWYRYRARITLFLIGLLSLNAAWAGELEIGLSGIVLNTPHTPRKKGAILDPTPKRGSWGMLGTTPGIIVGWDFSPRNQIKTVLLQGGYCYDLYSSHCLWLGGGYRWRYTLGQHSCIDATLLAVIGHIHAAFTRSCTKRLVLGWYSWSANGTHYQWCIAPLIGLRYNYITKNFSIGCMFQGLFTPLQGTLFIKIPLGNSLPKL